MIEIEPVTSSLPAASSSPPPQPAATSASPKTSARRIAVSESRDLVIRTPFVRSHWAVDSVSCLEVEKVEGARVDHDIDRLTGLESGAGTESPDNRRVSGFAKPVLPRGTHRE